MFKNVSLLAVVPFLLSTLAWTVTPARAFGEEWLPVDKAQLTQSTPTVEKDAEAEVLFWDVKVQDSANGSLVKTILENYIRIKVFTEKGKEAQSKIEIPYFDGTRIVDIAGRTIKTDGSIVDLKPDAIFDREIVKIGRAKFKAKTFAMPAVEAGVIVEYRWKEIRPFSGYARLQLQRDIPMQKVVYHIRPYSDANFPYGMRTQTFHGNTTGFTKEGGGFYLTSMTNVPAFHEEPDMPPEDQVRPWMLVFYSEDSKLAPEAFWLDFGKRMFDIGKGYMKVNDDIKKTATDVAGPASSPDEKIERIFNFCRTKIKNTSDDASGLTDDDRAKLKDNKNPWDTLKRAQGTNSDVNMLFASLCTAAGLDARLAALSDRSDFFFDPSFPDTYFLNGIDVAVKVGDSWRVYDPASMYVPYGMLNWYEEGVQALVADPKQPVWVDTPLSAPEKSKYSRRATLELSEDGTIEGDVSVEYTGHLAEERKEYNDDDSPTKREETVRDDLKERLSTAEVSNISVTNANDPDKPFTISFHVRVPGYAQRTGKRLFLQPSFFQYNQPARFTVNDRRHLVYLHYSWSEEDEVTIKLPAGFALDNADAPEPFGVGKVGVYNVKVMAAGDNTLITYKRSFFFGGEGSLYFPAANYAKLKLVFDTIHERDGHTITLKQTGTD